MERKGWMIEKLYADGSASGLVFNAQRRSWTVPSDGTLFRDKAAALAELDEWMEWFDDQPEVEINEHVFTD